MKGSTLGIVLGIGLVAVGVGWLLDTLDPIPKIEWVWTIGLVAAGVLVLIFGGLNKATLVLGPALLCASVLTTLEQLEYVEENLRWPIMVCAVGVLLLLVFVLPIPIPEMLKRNDVGH